MRTIGIKLSVYALVIFLIGTAGVASGVALGLDFGMAAPLEGPTLSIPVKIPAKPNGTVVVPVSLTSQGVHVSSMVFSLDYDQSWLRYDENPPPRYNFVLPPDFSASCTADLTDADGELDCVVFDPLPPLAAVPDGVFLNVTLNTLNAPDPTEATVGFSHAPSASFGDNQGQSVPGSTIDGSVQIGDIPPPTLFPWQYLPIVLRNFLIMPSASPIPSATFTPTRTVTPTGTVSPTPTNTPPSCPDLIENSGFEKNSDWEIPNTEYWAEYSEEQAHNGNRSMRTGIIRTRENIYSYSSARQMVTIPSNADSAELTLWIYQISEDVYAPHTLPSLTLGVPFGHEQFSGDFQYILILDSSDNLIDVLFNELGNTRTWKEKVFDLSGYAGWTIQLEFGTYNTGLGDVSAMYVDDVSLEMCR